MMDDQYAAMLAKIAEGNESALHEFYVTFERPVYAFALSRLRNEFDAAECTNEVMMEVWKSAHSFAGRSQVRTWVLGIANFKVLDCLRRRKRHDADVLDKETIETLANDDTPMQDVLGALDDAEIVRFCLEKLSASQSQIIHLVFYEELSYPEIAVMIDCPEGTVKTRVFHAKKNLMNCLANRLH